MAKGKSFDYFFRNRKVSFNFFLRLKKVLDNILDCTVEVNNKWKKNRCIEEKDKIL